MGSDCLRGLTCCLLELNVLFGLRFVIVAFTFGFGVLYCGCVDFDFVVKFGAWVCVLALLPDIVGCCLSCFVELVWCLGLL